MSKLFCIFLLNLCANMDQHVKVDSLLYSYYKQNKTSCSLYTVVNMEEYKTGDILSEVLDLVEETKDKGNIITQSAHLYQSNKGNHNCILYLIVL